MESYGEFLANMHVTYSAHGVPPGTYTVFVHVSGLFHGSTTLDGEMAQPLVVGPSGIASQVYDWGGHGTAGGDPVSGSRSITDAYIVVDGTEVHASMPVPFSHIWNSSAGTGGSNGTCSFVWDYDYCPSRGTIRFVLNVTFENSGAAYKLPLNLYVNGESKFGYTYTVPEGTSTLTINRDVPNVPGLFDYAWKYDFQGESFDIAGGTKDCADEIQYNIVRDNATISIDGDVPPLPSPSPGPTPSATPFPSPSPFPSPGATPRPSPLPTPDNSLPGPSPQTTPGLPGPQLGSDGLAEADIYEAVRRALIDAGNTEVAPTLSDQTVSDIDTATLGGLEDAANDIYLEGQMVQESGRMVPFASWNEWVASIRDAEIPKTSVINFPPIAWGGGTLVLEANLSTYSTQITVLRALFLLIVTILFLMACLRALRD